MQRADLATQPQAFQRVERRQRLIEQQQSGGRCQGARQRDALLLATRELPGIFGARVRQADQLEQLAYTAVDFVAALAPVDEAVGDVVENREIGKQRIGLEHDTVIALHRRQP